MIWLYNSKSLVGLYRTFEGVSDYFMRLEHFRTMGGDSFPEERWEFSYHLFEHFRGIFEGLEENSQWTEMEREAYENKLDLIEVCAGNFQTFQQIPLFPDIDIGKLERKWCFDYAKAKNFSLFELIEENVAPRMEEPCRNRLYSLTR